MALFAILAALSVGVLIANFFIKSAFVAIVGACFGWALAFQHVAGMTGEFYRYGVAVLITFHILMALALVTRRKGKRYVGR